MAEGERSLAIFVDFENLALGFQGRRERFDISRVLERIVEKGKIVAKKAYADWNRFSIFTHALHEAAIELIEIPRRGQTGKNSADIRLCVDAMDLAYSKEHINTFVIVSGDSDFSPLVSKLKELGKHVIGLGMQDSTSDLLRDNCDEFIYYEDLGQTAALAPNLDSHMPEPKRKAFALLMDSLVALRRENKDVLWSSMIKDTMKRKKPSFNETYHGYRTFSEMLEDAEREGLLELDTDKRSRTYVVTRFGSEMQHEAPEPRPASAPPGPAPTPGPGLAAVGAGPEGMPPPGQRKGRRRRRRGRGAGGPEGNGNGGPPPRPAPAPVVEPRARPVATAPGPQRPAAEVRAAPTPPPAPPPPPEPEPTRAAPTPPPVEKPAARVPHDFAAGLDEPEPAARHPEPKPAPEPAPKPRTRRSSGTKTTTPRTRRGTKKEKAAEPAAETPPATEKDESAQS